MVSPSETASLLPEEVAELLGAEAASATLATSKPKRGRPRKGTSTAAPITPCAASPRWLPLAELAGATLRASLPGQSEIAGRLTQRDGVWGLWTE